MSSVYNSTFGEALLRFNEDAVLFCRSISDTASHDYAIDYTRMLQSRAKGIETEEPGTPTGLFEANRNLIRSTLKRMFKKHFAEDRSDLPSDLSRSASPAGPALLKYSQVSSLRTK